MKKTLLLFFAVIMAVAIDAQDIESFTGLTTVQPGTTEVYYIRFKEGLKKDTKLIFNCAYGKLESSTGPTYIEKMAYSGETFTHVTVFWNDITISGGPYVSVYTETHPGLVKRIDVKIEKIQKPSGTYYITGPEVIYPGETGTYTCKGVGTSDKVNWSYDSSHFEKIVDEVSKDQRNITLKAKKMNTNITSILKAEVNWGGNSSSKDSKTDTITIVGNPSIKPESNGVICNNETVSYSVNYHGYYPNSTITWEAVENMTLVSGQGTNTATFRTNIKFNSNSPQLKTDIILKNKDYPPLEGDLPPLTPKGEGKIKATIKYNNTDFTVENSDLWIGSPEVVLNQEINERQKLLRFGRGVTHLDPMYTYDEIYYNARGEISSAILNWGRFPQSPQTEQIVISNRCGSAVQFFTINPIYSRSLSNLKSEQYLENKNNSPVSVKVYSSTTGQLVYQKKNVINFDINNTTLRKGIYILNITDENGNETQEKIKKTE